MLVFSASRYNKKLTMIKKLRFKNMYSILIKTEVGKQHQPQENFHLKYKGTDFEEPNVMSNSQKHIVVLTQLPTTYSGITTKCSYCMHKIVQYTNLNKYVNLYCFKFKLNLPIMTL